MFHSEQIDSFPKPNSDFHAKPYGGQYGNGETAMDKDINQLGTRDSFNDEEIFSDMHHGDVSGHLNTQDGINEAENRFSDKHRDGISRTFASVLQNSDVQLHKSNENGKDHISDMSKNSLTSEIQNKDFDTVKNCPQNGIPFSRKSTSKTLKHNPKIWDNLKFSSELVNSETSSDFKITDEIFVTNVTPKEKGSLKMKFKFQKNNSKTPTTVKQSQSYLRKQLESPNIDQSNTSDLLGFSMDLPDTLKQSLKEMVELQFVSAMKDGQPASKRKKANNYAEERGITQTGFQNKEEMQGVCDYKTNEDNNFISKKSFPQDTDNGNRDGEINMLDYPLISTEDSDLPLEVKEPEVPDDFNESLLPDNSDVSEVQFSNLYKPSPRRYGQRPQICGHCGKLFLDPYNFKQHLLIHTGLKPFKCDICGRGFSRNNHLTRHILIHTGEKPYHCDICGSDFSRSSTLALHKRSHTKEKNYNCKICGKDFTLYWNLMVHLRIHTGERPFKCQICHKTSRQKSDFNRHMKTHTGEKPFTCFLCNTKFSRSSCLKRHWNKFHPEKGLEENVAPGEDDSPQDDPISQEVVSGLAQDVASALAYKDSQALRINEGKYIENEDILNKGSEDSNVEKLNKQTYEFTFNRNESVHVSGAENIRVESRSVDADIGMDEDSDDMGMQDFENFVAEDVDGGVNKNFIFNYTNSM